MSMRGGSASLPLTLCMILAAITGCDSKAGGGGSGGEVQTNANSAAGDNDSQAPRPAMNEEDPEATEGDPPELSDQALADFSVTDVNAESARYGEDVSPRDYLGQISAWYFGHST